jgi:uncharacterized protein YcbX
MPSVARLSIAPVRSLGLEHPESIDVTPVGVVEDRRFLLSDDRHQIVDRIVVGQLVQIAAHTDPDATTLRLTFPDGRVMEDDVALGEPIEVAVHKRTAAGHVVLGPWAEALSEFCGRPITLVRCEQPGGTRRGNAVSLVTDGSLAALADHSGVEAVDGRRFRMLIELEGAEPHEEDGWIGGRVAIADAVLLITKPDARCAITTQDPNTGIRDLDTLRTLIGYRGLREGKHADFGVLGEVARPGRIRLGDRVTVLTDAEQARETRATG